jgi:NitT/TauT family transport system permease protein
MAEPISELKFDPINLSLSSLVEYSMRTTLRMFIGIVISLIFTLPIAYLAAKNLRAEQILIPVLDILQSVPILGYVSFTLTAFLTLFPGSMMGAEMAAIFAIFTSQVWNMIFSFYQSLKNVPNELIDAAEVFEITNWQKFWRIEVPYGIPGLVWNIVISLSNSWFYVVASEVIIVGSNKITLPGIGSYIALAITEENTIAVFYAVIAMTIVIMLYDQLLLRPVIVWADKFKYERISNQISPTSIIFSLFQKNLPVKKLFIPIRIFCDFIIYCPKMISKLWSKSGDRVTLRPHIYKLSDNYWYFFLAIIGACILFYLINFIYNVVGLNELIYVLKLACITLARVVILIIIASALWVPIGIYIGLNRNLANIVQPITQFLASFPANLLFPVMVILITNHNLNPNIWLSPLMIMNSQWYILFNVIAGTTSLPNDLKEVIKNLNISGLILWRKIIFPLITPYFITGAITASGAAWNASIIAEFVNYGDKKIIADGLGSYITQMTINADFPKVTLGVSVMALFVVFFNKIFWNPINNYATKKFPL